MNTIKRIACALTIMVTVAAPGIANAEREPCNDARIHEVHEATEHNVAERVIEHFAPTIREAHEQRIREDCADREIHRESNSSPEPAEHDHGRGT